MPTEIFPFVTLIIGWILSEMGSWFKNYREEKARKRIRAEQKLDERTGFQRQTLIDLQDGLFELAKLTGHFYSEDEMAYKQSGVWGKNLGSDEESRKHQDILIRTNVLMVRVADGKLREEVDGMRSLCTTISIARSQEEADQAFEEAKLLFAAINSHVGTLLRSTY